MSARPSPLWMQIVNVTPDSFSDGGQIPALDETALIAWATHHVEGGATLLDIGGESTRPGALDIPAEEEWRRVRPVIACLRQAFPQTALSIDTRKASVAQAALNAGVSWVNDVSGLRHDPEMVQIVAETQAPLVLMHSVGTPATMQSLTDQYDTPDIVEAVYDWLARQADWAIAQGVKAETLWLDPGIGFGKTLEQNLALINGLPRIVSLGFPVLLGVSRKRFLDLDKAPVLPPPQREAATAMVHWQTYQQGVQGFRAHNVAQQARALELMRRL